MAKGPKIVLEGHSRGCQCAGCTLVQAKMEAARGPDGARIQKNADTTIDLEGHSVGCGCMGCWTLRAKMGE